MVVEEQLEESLNTKKPKEFTHGENEADNHSQGTKTVNVAVVLKVPCILA